jgi:hypothetical protein
MLLILLLFSWTVSAALATLPLVAYWNMNEASIASFAAVSGSCNPAADVLASVFSGGSVGTSGGVSGFSNYYSTIATTGANTQSSYQLPVSTLTISFKFRVLGGSSTNKNVNLMSKGAFSMYLLSSGNNLYLTGVFSTSSGGPYTVSLLGAGNVVAPGTWYAATFSYSGSSALIYLNSASASIGAVSGALTLDSSSFVWGCSGSGTGCFITGFDEVRVYSSALSATEVAAITTATSQPTILSISSPASGLLLYSNPVDDLVMSSTISGNFGTASYLWEVISGSCSSVQLLTPSAPGTTIDLLDVGFLQLRFTVQDTLTCQKKDFSINSTSVLPSYSGANPGFVNITANTYIEVPITVRGFPTPTVTWEYAGVTNQSVLVGNDTVFQMVTTFIPFGTGAPLQLVVNPTIAGRRVTNFNGTFNNTIVHAVISNGVDTPIVVGNWSFAVVAAPSVANSTSSTPTNSGNATPGTSSSDSNIGAIVGAVVGGGGGLLLLLVLLCCCCCFCFCLLLIVVIVVVAVVVIILVVAVIAVGGLGVAGVSTPVTVLLMRRRGGFKLVPPDFSLYAFGGFVREDFYKEPASKRDAKRAGKLLPLIQADSVLLTQAVCQVSPVSDLDKVCPALVFACFPVGTTFEAVSTRVAKELAEQKLGTLFRANEAATKLFSAWAKVVGIRYLWDLFAVPIHELGSSLGEFNDDEKSDSNSNTAVLGATNLELDPTKLGADFDAEDLEVNVLELQLILQKLLNFICNRVSSVPSPIVHFLKFFNDELRKKYEVVGMEYTDAQMSAGLGSFFFLRFVCPAVTNPHVYGIVKAPPSEGMHRQLIMIGKVL